MIDKEILEDDLRILKRDFSEHFWEIVALTEMFLSGKLVEPMSADGIKAIIENITNGFGDVHKQDCMINEECECDCEISIITNKIAEALAGKVGKGKEEK